MHHKHQPIHLPSHHQRANMCQDVRHMHVPTCHTCAFLHAHVHSFHGSKSERMYVRMPGVKVGPGSVPGHLNYPYEFKGYRMRACRVLITHTTCWLRPLIAATSTVVSGRYLAASLRSRPVTRPNLNQYVVGYPATTPSFIQVTHDMTLYARWRYGKT